MKNSIFNIYKLLFFFIPIHFFFDFNQKTLYIVNQYEVREQISVPLPVGALAILGIIVIGFILSVLEKKKIKRVLSLKQILFNSLIIFPLFALYAFFISQLSITRIIQVIFPLLIMNFLTFPQERKDRLHIFFALMAGAFIFFSLHLISIFQRSSFTFMSIYGEYDYFFGLLLYQSKVSYTGVLSLYFFLSLFSIFIFNRKNKKYMLYFTVIAISSFVLMLIGSRTANLIEIISGIVIIIFLPTIFNLSGRYSKRAFLYILALIITLPLAYYAFINSPMYERFSSLSDTGNIDSSRLAIFNKAITIFYKEPAIFFWGAGGDEAPGLHNYIMDQVYRLGIFGFLFLFIIIFIVMRAFLRRFFYKTANHYARITLMVVIFNCVFLQSMVNASISQPYYFINLLMVGISAYFIIYPSSKSSIYAR